VSSFKRTLVTSALPYANGPIHLGHLAGCYLPADIYTRYQRHRRQDIIHICGTDENGVPITIRAEKEEVSPQEIVDRYHQNIAESFQQFGISFDNFSRTSLPIHHRMAQEFFSKINRLGFIEPRVVKQLYCDHCQRFLADRYIEGTCPNCGTPGARGDQCENCGHWLEPTSLVDPICKICNGTPRVRKTKHWFFRLDAFQDRLQTWLADKTQWKSNVKEFTRGWLDEGLKPRAITRDLQWGVPVPLKEAQDKVLYVWFDAPIGYISSTIEWSQKRGQPDLWKAYWLDEETRLIHFIGKDNIVFHALVWPATLMAYDEYILPAEIPANEFLNMEGKQLSTSRNWAVWLPDYLQEFSPDPLRYCLAINAPENRDSDFTWTDFQSKNNGDLADVLGNFINRTLTFVTKYFDSQIPQPGPFEGEDQAVIEAIKKAPSVVGDLLETFQVKKALAECMNLARLGNKYFNDQEPWRTRREDPQRCATTLHLCAQMLSSLSVLFNPFLPFSTEKLWKMLNQDEALSNLDWEQGGELRLGAGHRIGPLEILFPKIEDQVIERQIEKLRQGAQQPPAGQ
jgi:methionyl-tRNA synthetase